MATQNKTQLAQSIALANMYAAMLASHPALNDSITNAVNASVKDASLRVADAEGRNGAFASWMQVGGNVVAELDTLVPKRDALSDEDRAIAAAEMAVSMAISKLPRDASKNTVATIKTYTSRLRSMVPIMALPNDAFASLWNRADIKRGQDAVEAPAKRTDIKQQDAVKLIRVAAQRPFTAADVLNASLAAITSHIKELAKAPKMEGTPDEKAQARADSLKLAQSACEQCFEALDIHPELPVVGQLPAVTAEGEELPDVQAEGEQRQAAAG